MKLKFAFWNNLDENDKSILRIVLGLFLLAFTIFTLVSFVSYLFTWKFDQSLLMEGNMLDADVQVYNSAGKLGFRFAHFFNTKSFGLASFVLVLVQLALVYRLLFKKGNFSLIKFATFSFVAMILLSFILSLLAMIVGDNTMYGGGLGGEYGTGVVVFMENLVGRVVAAMILLILSVLWLLFLNKKFMTFIVKSFFESHSDTSSMVTNPSPSLIGNEAVTTVIEDGSKASSFGNISSSLCEQAEQEREADIVNVNDIISIKDILDDEKREQSNQLKVVESEEVRETVLQQNQGAQLLGQELQPQSLPLVVVEDGKEKENGAATGGMDGENMEIILGGNISTQLKKPLPRIDVRDELPAYNFPPLELLGEYSSTRQDVTTEELTRNNNKIRATLLNYNIKLADVKAIVGPTVTLYKVIPSKGVKIASIKNLQEDIAMSLHAKGVRIVNLPDAVGIEVANDSASTVPLRAMLNDDSFRESKAELPVAIGYTITQKVKVFDLADAPHLLVAGATKQGKSVGLNVIVSSLLYSKHPSELKMVFIDPKMVEFSSYEKLLKHYLAVMPDATDEQDEISSSIVKDAKKAEIILRSLCIEMDQRYELLSKSYVNNVKLYNEKYKDRHLLPTEGHRFLPYIVIIIDEYADLTMSVGTGGESKALARSITTSIIRLAQKGRAAGLHVILATQRPSVDVITGLIKANFPTRISFRVMTRVDSSTILDSPGAEKLIGRGDMLYYAGVEMERIQCAFISNDEINKITSFIGEQRGYKKSYNTPYYLPQVEESADSDGGGSSDGSLVDMKNLDESFEEAAKQVVLSQKGSTSDLQRRLGTGYPKAARVMDQLEAAGIVGPQEGSKPRQVLVPDFASLEPILDAFLKRKN